MTTETMREAVARAMDEALRAIDSDARLSELTDDEVRALTDAAIRTVLERLRDPSEAMVEAGGTLSVPADCSVYLDAAQLWPDGARSVWQAMLDAAVREVG